MLTLQALILGIVQGLTELLPISSSAHLFIIPWIFNWNSIPNWFDVALHFGTLLAIGLFFFKDWVKLIKGGYQYVRGNKNLDGKLFWYIVIATIPGGLIGALLDKYGQEFLTKPVIIAIALIIMGVILYYVDKNSKSEIKYKDLTLKQTFLIGISQVLAFIPGVSRSGVTMTMGRFLGLTRAAAARFSFLLSAPIVLGAVILKLKDFTFNFPFIVGVLASFIVGILVIKFLLEYLRKGSFKVFAVYRVVLGVIVLLLAIII